MEKDIPYFIEIRGCINCDVSKTRKEKTGFEYGFDHELMLTCLGFCHQRGFDLTKPYYDPEEVFNKSKENGSEGRIAGAIDYITFLRERFGEYYQKMNIPVDSFISELEKILNEKKK